MVARDVHTGSVMGNQMNAKSKTVIVNQIKQVIESLEEPLSGKRLGPITSPGNGSSVVVKYRQFLVG